MLQNDVQSKPQLIKNAENHGSALCFFVLLILAVSDLVFTYFDTGLPDKFILPAVSFCAFVVPSVIFFAAYRNKKVFFDRRQTVKYSFRLCIPACLLLISSNILMQSVVYYVSGTQNSSSGILSDSSHMTSLVLYAVLPAILEELVFRKIAFCAFEKTCGGLGAIIATSLFFAAIHFSVADFLTYFLAGVILGTTFYVTRSVIAAIIMHLVNNIISFYLSSAVFKIASESKSGFLAIFIVAAIFLLLLIWSVSELENICRKKRLSVYNDGGQASDLFPTLLPYGKSMADVAKCVFCSPFLWASVLIFFVFCMTF